MSGGSFGTFYCELNVQPQPCDCGWSVNTKITNGQETTVNEFPSMVALRDVPSLVPQFFWRSHNKPQACSNGCPHCTFVQPVLSNIQVVVGHHNLKQSKKHFYHLIFFFLLNVSFSISFNTDTPKKYAAIYTVSNVIVHPQYSKDPVNNDIAIYVTATPIEWSRGVGPICLPPLANA